MGIFDWLIGDLLPKEFTKESAANLMASHLKSRAELGDPGAQSDFGIICISGDGVPKDESTGLYWLKKSANQNFLHAEVALGNLFLSGTPCCRKDYNQAMEWYFKAVSHRSGELDANDNRAIFQAIAGLGCIYSKGKGLPRRTDEVINLLSTHADGVPNAYYLGRIFATGCYGRGIDEGKSLAWFSVMMVNDLRNSEELSNASEEFGIARRVELEYADQEGKRLDLTEIVRTMIKASSSGIAEAQYAMGIAHWYGWRGLQQNKERAIRLLEYASAQGHVRAQRLLTQLND
ncbi:tetratricopeptide repeat protein [Accumulibacter sp.]|uniref:tetratricopeptide repeat protein n=1 Tax=Accumulibacter sp. TaxID=2053492 RepID=UPI00260E126B|nr:tetratricopeptide repeat protein [Accumulibacter sp.]